MDAADIAWLRTAEGSSRAAEASLLLNDSGELSVLRRLGRTCTSKQARAAVSLALGRRTAVAKFEDADSLFCDRAAAEQASSELVARHLARRFEGAARVADLGCGMGGDALALAVHARVLAVDRDPARLAMMSANAALRGLSDRIAVSEADLLDWDMPPDIDAIWADPARRNDNGRRLEPEAWSPPLARVLELASSVGAAGIKLAPGIDREVLPADVELEFVSVDRDVKAAVLWLGRLARTQRTATMLPSGACLAGDPDANEARVHAPGRYLYDPDPSVGRAGLVGMLADQLGAWKLADRIAYLSGDERVSTSFARRFEVRSWFPFAERTLLEGLRNAGYARVEVTKRGSPVDTNDLERRLNARLHGDPRSVATAVLTRFGEQHIALICDRSPD